MTETTIRDHAGRPIRATLDRRSTGETWSYLLGDERTADGSRIIATLYVSADGQYATREDSDGRTVWGIVHVSDAIRWAREQVWTERERMIDAHGPARATRALGIALV